MEETELKKDLVEETKKAKRAEGKDTVCVACAFPSGLKLKMADGEVIELAGVPISHLVSYDRLHTPLPAGKYGTTTLKKSQWERILKEYGDCQFLKKEMVFVENSVEEATKKGSAYFKSGKKTGFEQASKEGGRTKKKSNDD